MAPGKDFPDALLGQLLILRDAEGLAGVYHIQQMMGYALHFLRRGFGGANVHAPVNLHGVHADNLTSMCLGQADGQGSFPAGRRPGQHPAERFLCHMRLTECA